jgi:type VI secretion system secreted protein Hcp
MKRFILTLFTLTAVSAASLAQAEQVFCKITGQKQGPIAGDVTTKGLEGTISVLSLSGGVISPRDPASGLPTGKRQHQPLVIVKHLDKASPNLFMSAVTNENLTSVDCSFYRHDGRSMQKYFRIALLNANISEFDIGATPAMAGSPQFAAPFIPGGEVLGAAVQTVKFTYQRITLEDPINGTIAEDDWQSPF